MKQRSEEERRLEDLRQKIIGLGELSQRKSYYPQLQERIVELERTNLALRESEVKYRSLVENINIGIFRSTPDSKSPIVQVNPALARIFGYDSVSEMLSVTPLDLYYDSKEREVLITKILKEGGLKDHNVRMKRRDGTMILCSMTLTPLRGPRGEIEWFDGVIVDITEQVAAEESLRKSEGRFRSLIEEAPLVIGISRNGIIVYANPRYLEMFGYERQEEILGHPVIDLFAPQDREKAAEGIRRLELGLPEPRENEFMGLRKDGSKFPFHVAVSEVTLAEGPAIIAFITDITERKRVEEALRKSEGKFRMIFDQAPVGITTVGTDGKPLEFNDELVRYLGYSREELGEMAFPQLTYPDDVEKDLNQYKDLISGKIDHYGMEKRYVRKDGEIVWAKLSVNLVEAFKDEPPLVLSIVSDITERKRAEEALQSSQQMFQLVLDSVPDRVFWKDRNLNYLGCNKNAARDAGLSDPSEIVGKNDHQLAWRSSASFYQADDRQVVESGVPKINFEETQIKPDGSKRFLQTSKVPLRDPEGKVIGVLGTYEDITERKRAEAALKESEERFRTLSDASFEGIVVHVNGLIADVNEAALEETGYSREEVIGKSILNFFTPDSVEIIEEVVRLPTVEAYEANLVRKNGEILTVQIRARAIDLNGQPARVATIMDITEQVNARKRIEELVARKEEERIRLKTILDTLPVGVIIADANVAMIEVNDLAREIMGGILPLAQSISDYSLYQGWWTDSGIKLRPEDWALVKAITRGETIKGQVIDVERFNGTRGTILNSAAPLKDTKGKIIGGVVVFQDITKQREMEHEAVEAKERAELYIDLLTHDINNINASTIGYLQLVLEKSSVEDKGRRQIQNSLDLLNNSSHLIENVKKIQSVESAAAKSELIDLGWLLEDVVNANREYPGKELRIEYEPQLKKMVMASGLLKDVFDNIITNAIKHNKGPVTIDIRLSKVYKEGKEFYKVTIEDNGQGIPDEIKGKIFSRLYRGKTKTTGRGLGLYLVKKLVEDSNGEVWVEDRVPGDHSKGAKFVVMLPVVSIAK